MLQRPTLSLDDGRSKAGDRESCEQWSEDSYHLSNIKSGFAGIVSQVQLKVFPTQWFYEA